MDYTAYKDIVFLTGAGISAESGLATFRGAGGLWEGHHVEDVATPEAYQRDPALVHRFYSERRAGVQNVQPNAAHKALARLEQNLGSDRRMLVVTQNVDDLHERGGLSALIHMHGELLKMRCTGCGGVHLWHGSSDIESICPACDRAGLLRPHIVWFGEMPFQMDEIYQRLEACDLFVSIGTSGNVYPAAGFVSHVQALGRTHTVELNLEPSAGSAMFHESRLGRAADLVDEFVSALLGEA